MSRIARFQVVVAAAMLLVGGQARAGFVSLPSDMGTLTTAGNYTGVGNYTFTFSNYSSTTSGGAYVPPGSVAVLASPSPLTGFELSAPLGAAPGSQNDISFDYTVATAGAAMTSVSLNANGFTNGGGIAQVVENVYTDSTMKVYLGQLEVTSGTTNLNLNGAYKSLFITEDIQYSVFKAGDTATFSITNQTFTVPEPRSIAMTAIGFAGICVFLRRRQTRMVIAC